MKEIEDMYKAGLLSERAYNEVAKIVGNLQEQYEMDMYKAGKRIVNLEMVIENLRGDIKIMVEKHATVKLDGYRELGQRAAEAENKLDLANAHIAVLEAAIDAIAGYATIETPKQVTEIINAAKRETWRRDNRQITGSGRYG